MCVLYEGTGSTVYFCSSHRRVKPVAADQHIKTSIARFRSGISPTAVLLCRIVPRQKEDLAVPVLGTMRAQNQPGTGLGGGKFVCDVSVCEQLEQCASSWRDARLLSVWHELSGLQ